MEDNKIVEEFLRRDEHAIECVSRKYGSFCMRIASNILSSAEDAEECVNDAYIRAWNSIPPDQPRNLRAYLGRLTRNAALDRVDYYRASKRDVRLTDALDELSDITEASGSTEAQYEQELIGAAISAFLHTIDQRSRKVFVRRYWYSDSIKDIAATFSMTQSAVKSMLARTRKRLKVYLTEEGIEL